MHQEPETAAIFMAPLLLGLAGAIAAVVWETGSTRLQWIFVAVTGIAGFVMSLWLIRVLGSAGPIAPLGGIWAVQRLNKWLKPNGQRMTLVSFALLLPFASIPWALAVSSDEQKPKRASANCLSSDAFTSLALLPPGLILAPINAGSHLLAFTPHSVLAAPYHRNNHGNVIALEALRAPADEARAIVIASGATYVAVCEDFGETTSLDKPQRQTLASDLAEGHVPVWLTPVPAANTPYKIFTVVR
jgi:hypothetical protein